MYLMHRCPQLLLYECCCQLASASLEHYLRTTRTWEVDMNFQKNRENSSDRKRSGYWTQMGDGFPSNLGPIQSVGEKKHEKQPAFFLSFKQDTQKYPAKTTGNFEFVKLWNLDLTWLFFNEKTCNSWHSLSVSQASVCRSLLKPVVQGCNMIWCFIWFQTCSLRNEFWVRFDVFSHVSVSTRPCRLQPHMCIKVLSMAPPKPFKCSATGRIKTSQAKWMRSLRFVPEGSPTNEGESLPWKK